MYWPGVLRALAAALVITGAASALGPGCALGQSGDFTLIGGNVQKRADGVLSLMAYSVVPDLAGSLLSIGNGSTGNPSISATQFGGGSLLGDAFPAYVEGSMGLSRYDPKFIATNG